LDSERGEWARYEEFGFLSEFNTTLELARVMERVNRNFDERRLTGAVILNVAIRCRRPT
jgi:hypothetical protein